MQDVIVNTALLDEYPYVNNHTLVIGVSSSSSNLYDLIKSLRSKFMGTMRYIGENTFSHISCYFYFAAFKLLVIAF
jgi:hypothetical protein